jgi:hypothetical protein
VSAGTQLLEVLKFNFNNRYKSTRLPMGLYIHAAANIKRAERTQAYIDFIKWTLTFPGIFISA